jgi:hypothetical protein
MKCAVLPNDPAGQLVRHGPFSMIKAKFGEKLRSKTHAAQVNEVLCKVLCHNLCCLIQSIYELGVEPEFWTES